MLSLGFITLQVRAQDSSGKNPVKIFNSERAINANTTEIVAKGKMDFKVTHNFDDIAGSRGGIQPYFFGLDNSTDIRIGFHLGISKHLNLIVSRSKGGGGTTKIYVPQLFELGLKYQLLQQMENDPSHPLSLTIFANNVISTVKSGFAVTATDTALNFPYTFKSFGERMSQVIQAIFAKKTGKVSLLLNVTLVNQGYVPLHDEKTIFALGGAIRLPLSSRFNLIIDYFHPFRSKASKDYFKQTDFSYNPPNDIDKNLSAFKFYDPLGIGLEILTAGHVFHLNFTNATQILENRMIPYTTSSWGKGAFRWGFNLSRTFTLWRDKK